MLGLGGFGNGSKLLIGILTPLITKFIPEYYGKTKEYIADIPKSYLYTTEIDLDKYDKTENVMRNMANYAFPILGDMLVQTYKGIGESAEAISELENKIITGKGNFDEIQYWNILKSVENIATAITIFPFAKDLDRIIKQKIKKEVKDIKKKKKEKEWKMI
jgi:hypothetical protein